MPRRARLVTGCGRVQSDSPRPSGSFPPPDGRAGHVGGLVAPGEPLQRVVDQQGKRHPQRQVRVRRAERQRHDPLRRPRSPVTTSGCSSERTGAANRHAFAGDRSGSGSVHDCARRTVTSRRLTRRSSGLSASTSVIGGCSNSAAGSASERRTVQEQEIPLRADASACRNRRAENRRGPRRRTPPPARAETRRASSWSKVIWSSALSRLSRNQLPFVTSSTRTGRGGGTTA